MSRSGQLIEPSRAVGSWLKAAEPPQTAHWQLACTTVLFTHSIAFCYFSAHLFSILYQITTFYRIYHDLFRPHTRTIVSLPVFKVSIVSACVMLACLAMQSCLLLTNASSSSSRSCLLFALCSPSVGISYT